MSQTKLVTQPVVITPEDWAAIEASQPSDYDGHTGFAQMTPAQRLEWLDSAVAFIIEYGGIANKPKS